MFGKKRVRELESEIKKLRASYAKEMQLLKAANSDLKSEVVKWKAEAETQKFVADNLAMKLGKTQAEQSRTMRKSAKGTFIATKQLLTIKQLADELGVTYQQVMHQYRKLFRNNETYDHNKRVYLNQTQQIGIAKALKIKSKRGQL